MYHVIKLFFEPFHFRSLYEGPTYISRYREELERKFLSSAQKRKLVHQLRTNSSHDFVSFFVCRNPVDHLLSTFGHHKSKFAVKKERNIPTGIKQYYSWSEFLRIIIRKENSLKLKIDQDLKRVRPCIII